MSKFEIGDRLKSKVTIHLSTKEHGPGIEKDAVYVVESLDDVGDPIFAGDQSGVGWAVGALKLYAKAGEFVAGDRVVCDDTEELGEFRNFSAGQVLTVAGVGGGGLILDGEEGPWTPRHFRLATSEEIALSSHQLTEEEAANLAPSGPIQINRTTDHEPRPIPAADFDFSTIKKGDEIVVRVPVYSYDGYAVRPATASGEEGHVRFPLTDIVSVIPAPKPKTLRERAIEAARSVVDDRDYLDDIVDAVLAEIEKGAQ